jgi:hypothetical protein
MKTFTFHLDQKVTMWVREYHEIEAITQEEANELFKKSIYEHDGIKTFQEQEFLTDTINYINESYLMTDDGIQI